MEDNTTKDESKVKKSEKANGLSKGTFLILGLIIVIAVVVWFGRDFFDVRQAAVVNGEAISQAEYNAKVKQIERQYELQLLMGADSGAVDDLQVQAQIKNIAMDELVNERLFLQAAQAAGITVSDEGVAQELELQKEGYPDEESYQADLREAGITEQELERTIKNQLTIIAYARSVIPESQYIVTEEELMQVYNLNYGESLLETPEGQVPVPTLEEFSQENREQFELQKLGMAVGPLIEELRANAEIEIFVDLPEIENSAVPSGASIEDATGSSEEIVEPLIDGEQPTE